MSHDYVSLIFSDISEVRRLLIEEFASIRQACGFTAEELDGILDLSTDWPTVSELESNPSLLTGSYLQQIHWALLELPDEYLTRGLQAPGQSVHEEIELYLDQHPEIIADANDEFRKEIGAIHLSTDPEKLCDDMMHGRDPAVPSPSILSARSHAATHIAVKVMHGLDQIG